ncbi:disulfide bond formation protein DsbA [Nonomuraea sp. NPDC046570]|uniref:mycothiol-dependent nitroreductase Rv2466c family protein n=1 Tax=Nonomuraea sp. NPDC046570 TaxID=3155255 RepID=UPI0033D228B9
MKIVDFWFDPACSYTWVTSRWMLEVAKVRPVELRWNLLSLSALNEHRDDDPEGDPEGYLWIPARICAAAEQRYGKQALGRLYTTLAPRLQRHDWDGVPTALTEAGLPEDLVTAGESTEYDDALRASTAAGIALVGPHIGTPVIACGGTAFFGPVLSQIPRGEQAGLLWDGTLLVAATPGFHELKGVPHEEPAFTL